MTEDETRREAKTSFDTRTVKNGGRGMIGSVAQQEAQFRQNHPQYILTLVARRAQRPVVASNLVLQCTEQCLDRRNAVSEEEQCGRIHAVRPTKQVSCLPARTTLSPWPEQSTPFHLLSTDGTGNTQRRCRALSSWLLDEILCVTLVC